MGVAVDQAGQQRVIFQVLGSRALVFLLGKLGRQQVDNSAAIDYQRMVFIGYGFRFNGYNPASVDEGIDIGLPNYNFLPLVFDKNDYTK